VADPSLPVSVTAPLTEVIRVTADVLGKKPRDVVVMVLDRPRNRPYVEEAAAPGPHCA
jgi:fructose-1,6-bisphosphatase II